jgi:hypothetical protein
VHVDASTIALGEVMTQPREGDIDHPITFARKNFHIHNRTTIIQKGKDWPWYIP